MSTQRRFLILAFLYMAQGLPYGFFTQALPTMMREQGLDLALIGAASLLALPWALKFLWSPFLDQYSFLPSVFGKGAHRRSWILLANFLAASGLVVLSFADLDWWLGAGIYSLFAVVFCMNFFAASQDISTDALAVEGIRPQERGLANGIQVAGYRVGMVLGGGLILGWMTVLGWQGAMWAMAGLLVLSCLPVVFWQQEQSPTDHDSYVTAYKGLFGRKGIWLWLSILVIYKMGDAFGTAMLRPMLVDQGLTREDIAWMLGTWGVVAGLAGAVLGGLLVKPLGRYKALLIFAGLQALSIGAYGFIPYLDAKGKMVFALCMIEHITGGMATAALFTLMMDYCRPTHGGLDYSLQSCLIVISGLIAGGLSGVSAQALGFTIHYAVALGFGVLAVIWVKMQRKLIEDYAVKTA